MYTSFCMFFLACPCMQSVKRNVTRFKCKVVLINFSFDCRYYIKESRGSRRWLLFLEGEYIKHIYIKILLLFQTCCCSVCFVANDTFTYEWFPGGWYCFNKQNCDTRYDTMRRLMSSTRWPQTRTGELSSFHPLIHKTIGPALFALASFVSD